MNALMAPYKKQAMIYTKEYVNDLNKLSDEEFNKLNEDLTNTKIEKLDLEISKRYSIR